MAKKVDDQSPLLPETVVENRVMDAANAAVELAHRRVGISDLDLVDARTRVKYASTEEDKDDAQWAIQACLKEQRDALRALNVARAARARMRASLK